MRAKVKAATRKKKETAMVEEIKKQRAQAIFEFETRLLRTRYKEGLDNKIKILMADGCSASEAVRTLMCDYLTDMLSFKDSIITEVNDARDQFRRWHGEER